VSNGDVRFKMPSQPVWQKSAGESMIHACLRLRESPIFWCISPWSLEGRVYLLTGPLSQRLHIAQARVIALFFMLHKLSFLGTMSVMYSERYGQRCAFRLNSVLPTNRPIGSRDSARVSKVEPSERATG